MKRENKIFDLLNITNKIVGWMSARELNWLYDTAHSMNNNSIIVELGCWLGKSTAAICLGAKTENIYVVDIWCGCGLKFNKDEEAGANGLWQFISNMKDRVNFVPFIIFGDSSISANKFKSNSIDFLFIDANHLYNSVINDIKSWYDKIKVGGIISGHDYFNKDVGRAVRDCFPIKQVQHAINHIDSIWWIIKD